MLSRDGEPLGAIEHVLADPEADIFEGLVIDRSVLPGAHRFVDAEQVGEIRERGVVLRFDRAGAEALPEPSAHAATMGTGPEDTVPDDLRDKLRRAWNVISGKE